MKNKNFLCCPKCNSSFLIKNSLYICKNSKCKSNYYSIDDIPILISDENELFNFSKLSVEPSPFFKNKGKLYNFLKIFIPDISHNISAKKNYKRISSLLKDSNKNVLVIGSGNGGIGLDTLLNSGDFNVIKTDICIGNGINYVCDAHNLPFLDCSFDLIVIQAVLEHVLDPKVVIREIHRVLKDNALVYSETPFMQQVHGAEYDFTRWTRSGHRFLFSGFSEVDSGQIGSVGMSLAWSIEYFIIGIFKYKCLYLPTIIFLRYFIFLLKYFDYIVVNYNNNRSSDGSSGFYFIGRKIKGAMTNSEIISYYR